MSRRVYEDKSVPTGELGNLSKVAAILIEAAKDPAVTAKHGGVRHGWDIRTRNRLSKEAGCGYSAALDFADDLRKQINTEARAAAAAR